MKLTKTQKKKIARVWAGEILCGTDGAFKASDVGLTDEQLNDIVEMVVGIGERLLINSERGPSLKDIVENVTTPELIK